ncbi:MAG: radical SAM protein, partial [Reyranella sp.]|nr:radical SAM protein [Reyranella sp.]
MQSYSPLEAPVDRPEVEMVIIQPTPFCNINCSYCYLPDRSNKHVLSQATVTRLFTELFASGWTNPEITILWHAGEPLAVPISFYREAFATIEGLRPKDGPRPVRVKHSFQTNGMLITDAWCDLFKEWDVGIGVSIDGPRELHDFHRKTRSGAGTFDKTIAGIRCLREAGYPFHVLSVLSRASLEMPEEMLAFYISEG